jgi:hypothetical protein
MSGGNYQYNLMLKQTGPTEWTLFAEKGHALHVLNRCYTRHEAEERARTWASTWASVSIKVSDEQN